MMIMSIYFIITFSLAFIIMTLTSILSKKQKFNQEKSSPYECGFDPKSSARLPFSLRFFLITVIFLIFDVEITLLIPVCPTITHVNIMSWMFTITLFLMILLIGLYYEWSMSALDWIN